MFGKSILVFPEDKESNDEHNERGDYRDQQESQIKEIIQ